MADNKCWMIDNLKYIDTNVSNVDGTTGTVFRNGAGPNVPSTETGTRNTVDGSTTSGTNFNKAFFNNPMSTANCYGSGALGSNMATNTLTHCGYFYNWYAATGGTGLESVSTNGAQVTGSICPVNFRLPSGASGSGSPLTDGLEMTHADFPVLNASMIVGTPQEGNIINNSTSYPGWQPGGAWAGVLGGSWGASLNYQGDEGEYWSSTAATNTYARQLYFAPNDSSPMLSFSKYSGYAVRCLVE